MFCKLFRYDIKTGILRRIKVFLFPLFLYIFAFADYMNRTRPYVNMGNIAGFGRGIGDALLFIYGGMKEYDPAADKHFVFPALWLLMYMLLAYLVLYYPHRDLEENGQNILIRTGGRGLWWLSKCVWTVMMVLLYFFLGWGVTVVGCIFCGVPLTMTISPNVNMLFEMYGVGLLHPGDLTVEILLLPPLVLIAACLVQMTLSLFIRPIFSYVVTASVMLSSSYYLSPILLGNYAMPIRSSRMIDGGMSFYVGCASCLLLISISVFVGMLRFHKYDIICREN